MNSINIHQAVSSGVEKRKLRFHTFIHSGETEYYCVGALVPIAFGNVILVTVG